MFVTDLKRDPVSLHAVCGQLKSTPRCGGTPGFPRAPMERLKAYGARRCPAHGGNPYAKFSGRRAACEDNLRAHPVNEPSDDLAALAPPAFARGAGG